jgi:hypothetical protein
MELVIGLIVLAVLIFVLLRAQAVFGKLLDTARIRAKRHLFMKREYAEGQKLVSCQIVFQSDFDIDDLREGILSQIQPVASPSVIRPSFFVERSSDDLIVLACGNKMQTFFKGALTLTRTGVGVEGSWAVVSWLRHDGIVAAREPMKQLVRHIHTGAMNVDPSIRFGLIHMHRSPRIVEDYNFQDHVQVDYVQDFEAGLPVVA